MVSFRTISYHLNVFQGPLSMIMILGLPILLKWSEPGLLWQQIVTEII